MKRVHCEHSSKLLISHSVEASHKGLAQHEGELMMRGHICSGELFILKNLLYCLSVVVGEKEQIAD